MQTLQSVTTPAASPHYFQTTLSPGTRAQPEKLAASYYDSYVSVCIQTEGPQSHLNSKATKDAQTEEDFSYYNEGDLK